MRTLPVRAATRQCRRTTMRALPAYARLVYRLRAAAPLSLCITMQSFSYNYNIQYILSLTVIISIICSLVPPRTRDCRHAVFGCTASTAHGLGRGSHTPTPHCHYRACVPFALPQHPTFGILPLTPAHAERPVRIRCGMTSYRGHLGSGLCPVAIYGLCVAPSCCGTWDDK